jgi:hypothetical protein
LELELGRTLAEPVAHGESELTGDPLEDEVRPRRFVVIFHFPQGSITIIKVTFAALSGSDDLLLIVSFPILLLLR